MSEKEALQRTVQALSKIIRLKPPKEEEKLKEAPKKGKE